MSFNMPLEASRFFRLLMPGGTGSRFATQFDAYYYCLLTGLDARRVGKPQDVGEEFVRSYVHDFQPYADLIAGLLIDAELQRLNVQLADAASIEQMIVRLLDPMSSTKLSKDGHTALDLYAAGGLHVLQDTFPTPPQSLEEFLVFYQRTFGDAADGPIPI